MKITKTRLKEIIREELTNTLVEQEGMSAYDLGAELRSIQMDTMHPGSADSPPVIRVDDIVLYKPQIEKAAKALRSLGQDPLARKLLRHLATVEAYVRDRRTRIKLRDEYGADGKLQSGAEMFYKIFDDAGDVLMRMSRK
jgi:hypothetical protein